MTLQPRQHFQEDQTATKFHQDLVVLHRFRDACHAALLEQVLNMPMTTDPVEAAAAYNRIMAPVTSSTTYSVSQSPRNR